jgi:hypothetical protein
MNDRWLKLVLTLSLMPSHPGEQASVAIAARCSRRGSLQLSHIRHNLPIREMHPPWNISTKPLSCKILHEQPGHIGQVPRATDRLASHKHCQFYLECSAWLACIGIRLASNKRRACCQGSQPRQTPWLRGSLASGAICTHRRSS